MRAMKGGLGTLLLGAVLGPPSARAQTVDEIIEMSLAARGGLERIKSTQSVRLRGRISMGSDAEGPILVELKRPGKMRNEITLKGKTIVRVTDGKAGWAWSNLGEVEALSEADFKNMAGGADFEGPLVENKAKGNKVELAGRETVEGKDAFKLKVTQKDGEVRFDYVDCASFLEIKWEGGIGEGGKVGVESFFRDYRDVGGLKLAFAIDSDTPGEPGKQHLVFDKGELNPVIDDARFSKPAPPSREAKP